MDIKRVLITGITGAAGRSMVEWLQTNHPEVKVFGTARNKHTHAISGVELIEADMLDMGSLIFALWKSTPNAIFHFAANPDKGFEIPSAIIQTNTIGSVNLFEACRICQQTDGWSMFDPVLVNVSSSEVYGQVDPQNVPITEDCPKRPVSPYGVSKLAQDNLGYVYHKAYNMPIVTTRAFTYVNFKRPDLFTSAFARQIALVEQGKAKSVKHGNLDSVRVMLNTEDILEAYWLAATKCKPGEAYNLGGGEKCTVGEVLDCLIHLSGHDIPKEADPSLFRPVDVTLQVPDSTKFKNETGWNPKFDLVDSMRELLRYWRKRAGDEK